MIGNNYDLKGMEFEIVAEKGDERIIDVKGEQDLGAIPKETLSDALAISDAKKI